MAESAKSNRRPGWLIVGGVLIVALLVVAILAGGRMLGGNRSQSQAALPTSTTGPDDPLLAFARCMRDNGVADFPDPRDGGINLLGTGIDVNSPAMRAAREACQPLLPTRSPGAPAGPVVPGASPWDKVVPGGETSCADGSEFTFWTRPADPSRVVLFLEGGGACWDATMCAFSDAEPPMYDWNITGGDDPVFKGGIFDLSNPANPLAGYSFVYVPYCTGDVHLGDASRDYSPTLTVEHKGFANGSTALGHLAASYPNATQVVIVGVSAGSVAAPVYAGLASDALPAAQIIVLADSSGAYPDAPDLNAEISAQWGMLATMPAWEVNEGLTAQDWSFTRFWIQAGRHDPEIILARFDYAFDANQAQRIALAGLNVASLLETMESNEAAIEAAGVVQHSYTAPGGEHGILNSEELYTMAVNGVTLVEWVAALLAGEPLGDVHCNGCGAE
jgi:hypothetical protein